MKSILSRYAIAAIVPALLIATAAQPSAAKPTPKAPTIVKAQNAIDRANPNIKAPKKNPKIEALHEAINTYYADLNKRLEPGEDIASGGFSYLEVVGLRLIAFSGNKAEVAVTVVERGYVGERYGHGAPLLYAVSSVAPMNTRQTVIKLEKKGSQWAIDTIGSTKL